jgi:4-amino-4-deoxy-L-arabinose transferase-like glycosyltransferase
MTFKNNQTQPSRKPISYFWAVVLLIMAFSILLKLPTLNLRHEEGDEVRFWYLTKNWIATGNYTLQGSPIFNIPTFKAYYGYRQMPVHPPLFPAVLRPFAQYENIPHYAVMASWLGHLLAILAVALIARYLIHYHNLSFTAFSPLFWLPLLGIATDPIMTWVSGKLWIDNLHAGLAALSIALALMANRFHYRQLIYLLSGILLGLALLSKLTAALSIPVIIYIVLTNEPNTKKRLQALLWGAIPVLVLSLPWYIPRYLTPLPEAPTVDWTGVQQCIFCNVVASKPFYYFFLQLILISPLIIIGLSFYFVFYLSHFRKSLGIIQHLHFLIPLFWCLFTLIAITYYVSNYNTFIMRRLTVMLPSLYVMFYFLLIYSAKFEILKKYQPLLLLLGMLTIVYGAIGGGYYVFHADVYPEFTSLPELARLLEVTGINLQ